MVEFLIGAVSRNGVAVTDPSSVRVGDDLVLHGFKRVLQVHITEIVRGPDSQGTCWFTCKTQDTFHSLWFMPPNPDVSYMGSLQ